VSFHLIRMNYSSVFRDTWLTPRNINSFTTCAVERRQPGVLYTAVGVFIVFSSYPLILCTSSVIIPPYEESLAHLPGLKKGL